jgi:hypothetical protein
LSGQKVEPLALHLATVTAVEAPHLQFQKNPRVAARQIAHRRTLRSYQPIWTRPQQPQVRFFERRLSLITRAFGSPKTPHTVGSGRKPGKQYASHSRRGRFAALVIHLDAKSKPAPKSKIARKSTAFLRL